MPQETRRHSVRAGSVLSWEGGLWFAWYLTDRYKSTPVRLGDLDDRLI